MANLVFNIVSGALPVLVEIVELEYSLSYYEYGEHTIYGLEPGTYTLHCTDINGCAVTIENIVIACEIPEGYEQIPYIYSYTLDSPSETNYFYNTDSLEDICDKLIYIYEQLYIYYRNIVDWDTRYVYVDIINYPTIIGSPVYDSETQCILEDGNYYSPYGILIVESGIISSIDMLEECELPVYGTTSTTSTTICINPTYGGIITNSQTICYNGNPVAFTSTADPSGYTGTLEYKWQYSETGSSGPWNDIPDSNSNVYDAPALTVQTWYKRMARVTCSPDWSEAASSNILEIQIRPTPTASIGITGPSTICAGGAGATVTVTNPQSLSVIVTYNINGSGSSGISIPASSSSNLTSVNTAGTHTYNLMSVAYPDASPSCTNAVTGYATVIVRPLPTVTIEVIGDDMACRNGDSPVIGFYNPNDIEEIVTYKINAGGVANYITVPASDYNYVNVPTTSIGTFEYILISAKYSDNNPGCSAAINGSATIYIIECTTTTIEPTTTTTTTCEIEIDEHPEDLYLCGEEEGDFFISTPIESPTYIWQMSFGPGWWDIDDSWGFTGFTTDQLTVNALYGPFEVRCKITIGGECETYSNVAYLYVSEECTTTTTVP